jgi:hypothetical protein
MRASTMLPAGGCKGTTLKGRPCQGKDVFENGYCKHHGGEGKSLTQRRMIFNLERAKYKAEKFAKRMERWKKQNPNLRRIMEAIKARQEEEDARRANQS